MIDPQLVEYLKMAKDLGASDLHIAVAAPPMMRLHNRLTPLPEQPRLMPPDTERLLLSVMSDEYRERLMRDGEVDLAFGMHDLGRFRINVYKQRGSLVGAIRLMNPVVPSAESLGMPQSIIDLYAKKSGLVLVTGPTGSGKSTTLAAMLDNINHTRRDHIVTLEDPVEYVYKPDLCAINQREVGRDTRSFSDGLRASLREDPNVILIGEMRDRDTIETAITAAETGHLVFGTLHTGSASDAVDRIVQVFPEGLQTQIRLQLSMCLEAVLTQQLVPKKTGGRALACELMVVTDAIRNLIRSGNTPQIANAVATSAAIGGQTMDQALVRLVRTGQITRDVAMHYAHNADYVKKNAF